MNQGAVPAPKTPAEDDDILRTTAHRPFGMPSGPWAMTQRWNHLLFAHWRLEPGEIGRLLPDGLIVDTFDGHAWVGVVPFSMDRVRLRGMPAVPGTTTFPELNLRTYVRERSSNLAGVYFFSLDAGNPLAVAAARIAFHLPYYWARMRMDIGKTDLSSEDLRPQITYRSERYFASPTVRFRASYRSLGEPSAGPIEQFLTARYSLYTTDRRGNLLRGQIHHLPWPLERAEAEFELNELPRAHGITLPNEAPLLHYSRELAVYVWALEPLQVLASGSVLAAVAASETC